MARLPTVSLSPDTVQGHEPCLQLNLTPLQAPAQTPSPGAAPQQTYPSSSPPPLPPLPPHVFHPPCHAPPPQRQFALDHCLPRSTLGYWLRRRPGAAALEPALVAFLDSPSGYRFLRRLVAALHLVFHL